MLGMIKSVQKARSNISEIYHREKENYDNSEGNFIKYIRCDMLIQIGMFVGIISIMMIFSGLFQLISLNSVLNSSVMILIGVIGIFFTKNSMNKGFNKMF